MTTQSPKTVPVTLKYVLPIGAQICPRWGANANLIKFLHYIYK